MSLDKNNFSLLHIFCLAGLAQGFSIRQIAVKLGVTYSDIKAIYTELLETTGTDNKKDLLEALKKVKKFKYLISEQNVKSKSRV